MKDTLCASNNASVHLGLSVLLSEYKTQPNIIPMPNETVIELLVASTQA